MTCCGELVLRLFLPCALHIHVASQNGTVVGQVLLQKLGNIQLVRAANSAGVALGAVLDGVHALLPLFAKPPLR